MNLHWIFKIQNLDTHLKDKLKDFGDMKLLYNILQEKSGTDAFLEVSKTFLKTYLKIIEKPFNDLKKVYVYQNKRASAAELARELEVDETTIYAWWKEMGIPRGRIKTNNTINMFGDKP